MSLTTFEGRSPEELQAKVRRSLGAEIDELTVVRHGRQRYGGVLGFFQSERWLLQVEVPDDARSTKAKAKSKGPLVKTPVVYHRPVDPAPANAFDELLDNTTDLVNVNFGQTFAHVMADAEQAVGRPAVAARRVADRQLRLPDVDQELRVRARLIGAGLSDYLLPDTGEVRPELALLGSLLRLPAAPLEPTGHGDVLLLAGPLDAAIPLGQQLAERSGIPSDLGRIGELSGDLIVASDRALPESVAESSRARTPEEAGSVVFRRRAKGKTTVVVLDALEVPKFVTAVVAGVRPDAIWGVVPAGWTLERTQRLEELTGAFDAIALEGFMETDRPAQLIGREWPVSYVDGWAATPLSITARLMEALGDTTAAHGA